MNYKTDDEVKFIRAKTPLIAVAKLYIKLTEK